MSERITPNVQLSYTFGDRGEPIRSFRSRGQNVKGQGHSETIYGQISTLEASLKRLLHVK